MKKLAQICQESFIATVLILVLACPMWAGEMPQPVPPPTPVVSQTPLDSSAPVDDSLTSGTATQDTQIATVESLAEALLTLLQNSFALL